MKSIISILVTLHISLITLNATAQWYPLSCGTEEELKSVSFVDSLHGWVSGVDGIFHTMDGGTTWEHQGGDHIGNVSFIDQEHGWINDYMYIIRTIDGGDNWDTLDYGFCEEAWCQIDHVCFVDTLTGWVSITEGSSRRGWSVFSSQDGGYNWNKQFSPDHICSGDRVNFTDTLVGCAIGCVFVVTDDGGNTWTEAGLENVTDAVFRDSINGWAIVGSRLIMHTSDGGETWEEQYNSALEDLNRMTFVDTLHGCIVGNGGTILYTGDGGQSWEDQSPGWLANFYDVCFVDPDNGWVVGEDGTIWHTDDATVRVEQLAVSRGQLSAYPNPTNGTIMFRFRVSCSGHVTVKIYDLQGREVMTVVDKLLPAGKHEVGFNTRALPPGVYIYKMLSDRNQQSAAGRLMKI